MADTKNTLVCIYAESLTDLKLVAKYFIRFDRGKHIHSAGRVLMSLSFKVYQFLVVWEKERKGIGFPGTKMYSR